MLGRLGGPDTSTKMRSLILNFHGVGPVLRSIDHGELGCWLDQDFFEAVLDFVRDQPHVGITVDDGNESDVSHILPALLKRGLRAKFFVCSGRLDQHSFLSRRHICQLVANGMEIGSHGVAHLSWRGLSREKLRDELETSRRMLEEACEASIDEAACPFGSYDRRVLAALRQAGYRRVYTSDGGLSGGASWIVPRTTVTRRMSLDDVRNLLEEGPGVLKQLEIHAKSLGKRLR